MYVTLKTPFSTPNPYGTLRNDKSIFAPLHTPSVTHRSQ